MFCHRYPTETCGWSNLAVRSSRDNVASPTRRRLNRKGRSRLPAPRRSGARVGGMANTCEPLINVVKTVQPKVLTGWGQNGTGSVQGLIGSLPQTSRPSAKRRSLPHRVHQAKRGKPDVLPQGTAPRKGRPKGRRVKEEGASEGRPVMGRIGVERKATSPTRKRADFPLVSGHEKAGQTDQGGRADDGLDVLGWCGLPLKGRRPPRSIVKVRLGETWAAPRSSRGVSRGLSRMR
jgi:hypothetical protein